MNAASYYTLHPAEKSLTDEFFYGNMRVRRLPLVGGARHVERMKGVFESYLAAGLLPAGTRLIGDYLGHALVRGARAGEEAAGRYLGVVLPNGSYQYLRLEGESVGVRKRQLDPPQDIRILTDTCLFCAANATATLENGEVVSIVAPGTAVTSRVRRLDVSGRLCHYEMDSIVRLVDLIAAMAAGNKRMQTAMLAMPTVEYYFYLMDAYNQGFIESDMMLDWIVQVNRHAQTIIEAIRKRIGLETEICRPLEAVEAYVRRCVDRHKPADFEQTKTMLASDCRLWRDVLPIAAPQDWKGLNYTSYAISVLDCSRVERGSGGLTIDIENPSEQRILRNAARIARQLKKQGAGYKFRVLGIYPHEKVFIPEGDEPHRTFPRLYYLKQQSGHQICPRGIVEGNRRTVVSGVW